MNRKQFRRLIATAKERHLAMSKRLMADPAFNKAVRSREPVKGTKVVRARVHKAAGS